MAIRYDDQLILEIRRTVKNYQAKRRRLAEKGQDVIPDAAFVSTFMSDYTSRRELLRELKRLQRFSRKGSEEVLETEGGARFTRFEYEEYKRMATVAKRMITIRKRQLEENVNYLQPLTRGPYDNLVAQYEYLSRPIQQLTKRQWYIYKATAREESSLARKNRVYKENIITMVRELGGSSIPTRKLVNLINSMTAAKVAKLMEEDVDMNAILTYYEVTLAGGEVEDIDSKIENLIEKLNAL